MKHITEQCKCYCAYIFFPLLCRVFVYSLVQGTVGAVTLHTAIPIDNVFNLNVGKWGAFLLSLNIELSGFFSCGIKNACVKYLGKYQNIDMATFWHNELFVSDRHNFLLRDWDGNYIVQFFIDFSVPTYGISVR